MHPILAFILIGSAIAALDILAMVALGRQVDRDDTSEDRNPRDLG